MEDSRGRCCYARATVPLKWTFLLQIFREKWKLFLDIFPMYKIFYCNRFYCQKYRSPLNVSLTTLNCLLGNPLYREGKYHTTPSSGRLHPTKTCFFFHYQNKCIPPAISIIISVQETSKVITANISQQFVNQFQFWHIQSVFSPTF